MSAALAPETLLREMAELWVTLGKQGQAETGMGVLRACTMTLVVITDESDDVTRLGETIAALMPQHPARAIVVRTRDAAEPALEGRVFAQCWLPFGQRRQICCEQVEITASPARLEDAASIITAVVAPDLPVMVWCRGRMAAAGAFTSLATKIVFDTNGSEDPLAALRQLSKLSSRGTVVGDLSWTRLTRWREIFSHEFGSPERRARLSTIREATVGFGGARPPALALYMAAWLKTALQDAGAPVQVRWAPDSNSPGGQLRGVELAGADSRLNVAREGERLVITTAALRRCVSLPPDDDLSLMREELTIVGHDPIFEGTLAAAVAA